MNKIGSNLSETDAIRGKRNWSYADRGMRSLQPNSRRFSHESYSGTGLLSRPLLSLLLVALLGGLLIAWQLRTQAVVLTTATADRSAQTAVTILELIRTREQLAKQEADLAGKLTQLAASSEQSKASHDQAAEEHQTNQVLLGKTAVRGSGIQLIFDKSLTPTNVLDLVNALRNLSAEAISVNGQRFTGTSWLDEKDFSPPVTINAIGDQRLLDGGIRQRGGVLDTLRLSASISDVDALTMPAR